MREGCIPNYIEPTLQELSKGAWIGSRSLAWMAVISSGRAPSFDGYSLFHAALLFNGTVYQIVDKDKKDGNTVVITKCALTD